MWQRFTAVPTTLLSVSLIVSGCGSNGSVSGSSVGGSSVGGSSVGGSSVGGSSVGGSSTGGGPAGTAGANGGRGATATVGGAAPGSSIGSAGSNHGTAGSTASTVPKVDGQQCSPGQSIGVDQGASWATCYPPTYPYPYQLGIPGGGELSVDSVKLPSAAIPGAANAVSFPVSGSAPFDFELWGTFAACGEADELLWWSSFSTGTHCAQFVPSQAYTHLLVVERQMKDVSGYFFSTPTMNLCPGGTCQGKATGNGKQAGASLTAPAGHYPIYRLDSLSRGWDLGVGAKGRVVVALNGSRMTLDSPVPIAAGIFRMQAPDPYNDAWYCIGEGSTVARHDDENGSTNSFDFALRNITRLAVCSERTGTGTLSWQISSFKADIVSSLTPWVANQSSADELDCFDLDCRFRFYFAPKIQFAYLNLQTSPGSYYSPTRKTVPVVEAALFTQSAELSPFELNCGTSGSLMYDPAATTTLTLTDLGDSILCPGAAISSSSFDFSADQY